jgi:hypothetical protein
MENRILWGKKIMDRFILSKRFIEIKTDEEIKVKLDDNQEEILQSGTYVFDYIEKKGKVLYYTGNPIIHERDYFIHESSTSNNINNEVIKTQYDGYFYFMRWVVDLNREDMFKDISGLSILTGGSYTDTNNKIKVLCIHRTNGNIQEFYFDQIDYRVTTVIVKGKSGTGTIKQDVFELNIKDSIVSYDIISIMGIMK